MNIGPRHLIDWGIPGWTFLSVLMAYFLIEDYQAVDQIVFNEKAAVIVSAFSLFIGAGIILGNFIHQISIVLGFVVWTNNTRHFKEEWDLDLILMNHPHGKEIQRLYRSRLEYVHAVRALWFSLLLSFITLAIFCFTIGYSKSILFLMAIVFGLSLIVLINLVFIQNKFRYCVKRILSGF